MNFYNIKTGKVVTDALLQSSGLPIDNLAIMEQAGFVPLSYSKPEYDNYIETIVPSEIVLDEAVNGYVQQFDIVPLSNDEAVSMLTQLRQGQLSDINAQYDAIVAMAKTNVPDGEVLTWDIQKSEAETWAADNSAATPFIDGIAQGRGMDRVVLIEKVLVKTAAYRDFVAVKTGIRQGLEDAIFAAESVEAVRAIGWAVDDTGDADGAE